MIRFTTLVTTTGMFGAFIFENGMFHGLVLLEAARISKLLIAIFEVTLERFCF